jgi:hypothetical protein
MRQNAFHLSFYLSLAFATLCLGVADAFFLDWSLILTLIAWIFFYFAYRFEGRWILTEQAANTVGLVIAFIALGWIASRIPQSEEEALAQGVPWPAGLLPHLGPLLVLLTLAKVFRPKTQTDFWVLQSLGLMMVMLASVLAGEFHHAIWLFLYLASFFWCLTLHYRRRRIDGATRLFEPETAVGPRMAGFGSAVVLASLTCVVGMLAFLVAPRSPASQWVPYKLSSTGLAFGTGGIDHLDLNQIGKIELSDEIAFDVTQQDAQGNHAAPPEDVYWRTETLEFYRTGRWTSAIQFSDLPEGQSGFQPETVRPPESMSIAAGERPADMQKGQQFLAFRMQALPQHNLVFAERAEKELGLLLTPHFGNRPARSVMVTYNIGADSLTAVTPPRRRSLSYGQVWDPATRDTPRHAGRVSGFYRSFFLLQQPPEGLVTWTRELLDHLPGMSAADRTFDAKGRLARDQHLRVAHAFTRHLADSGEYLYTLNLRRGDLRLDPTFDFLTNVKEGHCERYASGLVLMLRSVGIPCRLVQGFRGRELDEHDEVHVRFTHAHSWAEALVPDPAGGEMWVRLDPTPSEFAPQSIWEAAKDWFVTQLGEARRAFRRGILEFGVDEQAETLRHFAERLRQLDPITLGASAGGAALLIGAVVVWRRRRPSARASLGAAAWMRDLVRLARQRAGLQPAASQTWSEFIAALQDRWRERLPAELNASLSRFAELQDHLRFGTSPIAASEEAELFATLSRLRAAL